VEARDDAVAVDSAGPYANHLHLASDKQPSPAPHHSIVYRLDALPDTQPTLSKY